MNDLATDQLDSMSAPIHLMIVDDVVSNRCFLRKLISIQLPEIRISEADGGKIALTKIQSSPPDILILDVRMPDMDGIEVCQRIKADPRTQSVLVLMVSGYMTDSKARISGLQSGADSYLCKPFENDELIAQIMALKRIFLSGQALMEEQNRLRKELTLRRQIEQQLEQAKNSAEAAVHAKDRFLAHMSHEIRTPMNAVIGMTEVLLDTPLSVDQQEYVQTINTAGETLLTVINDILDHSKIESGNLSLEQRQFRLDELLEDTIGMVRSQAERKGLRLQVWIAPDAPRQVVGDIIRLRQILSNLLSNAVKFTERGEVSVQVTSCRLDNHLCDLTFSVRDTGIGIPSEKMNRLFQAFSQIDDSTTRRFGGTGLGLSISQSLAKLMGGELSVESTLEKGSVFHARVRLGYFPRTLDESGAKDAPAPLKGRTVMIVDDNAVNRKLLTKQTESWEMIPVAMPTPEAALDRLRNASLPDVVLVDMQMPELDGICFAREVRACKAMHSVPMVLLSSEDMALAELEVFEAEKIATPLFSARLNKPIHADALYDVLYALLPRPSASFAPTAESVPVTPETTEGLHVLVAEDNPVNRKVAEYLLRRLGCTCTFAEDGRVAVVAARETHFDLVLMDVQMPYMDGVEALHAIREEHREGPMPFVAALTAHAMQGDREKYLAAGMDDYISKPIRIKELSRVIGRCRRRAARENPKT